jgi:Flp pilus assembly protein protease CpaA
MIELSLIIVFIALAIASYTDIKKREVPDWLSFSFIAASLAYALSRSVVDWSLIPITNSILGLAIFWIIANILYYGRLFAGGDAKLLAGIGAALGINLSFLINTLIIGGLYGLVYSLVLALIHIKTVKAEFGKVKIKKIPFILLAFFSLALGIIMNSFVFYLITALAVISPLLYAFTFAVEKSALIKLVHPEKLAEGDWLASDLKIGNQMIKSNFEGLSKSEISLIKKANKPVKIKYGLPFVPVFFLAFLAELTFGNLFLVFI